MDKISLIGLSPDLEPELLQNVEIVVSNNGIDGLVVSNFTEANLS